MKTLRYGVHLPNSGPLASPEAITIMATTAELLGYDAVLPHDHVVWGHEDRYHHYAGSKELTDDRGGPTDFYEAMSTMSYLAGITKRVLLLPGAIALGWRPVSLLAREALTLHKLSGGRFVLCVCLGDSKRDYDAMGMSWKNRGHSMVDHLKALRMIIDNSGPISFQGSRTKFRNQVWNPHPKGLRLWYAGVTDIAVKRAARYCDGWMAEEPEIFRAKFPLLRQEAERVGRGHVNFELVALEPTCIAPTDEEARKISEATLEIHTQGRWLNYMYPGLRVQPRKELLVGSPQTVAEGVRLYKEAGVSILNLHFIGHSLGSILGQMDLFYKEVVPKVT